MDEHPESALHYGHVGRAIYLPETQTWTFSRSFTRKVPISYTGITKTSIQAPAPVSRPQPSSKPVRTADAQLIPHVLPELASQWSSLQDDAFSRVVLNASNICDPRTSSLLDLGYATHHGADDSRGRVPIAIAASVTGECGNTISFRVLTDETVELPLEGSAFRVPCIGDAEVTEWSKRGAPIQQICFAQPLEEKSVWMAARLQEATTIFRPLYHREPVPMYIPDDDTAAFAAPLRNSRLDANPVVDISQSQTGGFPHADVTFNPWYPRQLAIVDVRGNWSIWEISGRQRRRRATWAVTCAKKGTLPQTEERPDPTRPRHDGWAAIEWVADFSTILVSDRRCLMLYRLVEGEIESSVVELGMLRQSEWILDVQRSTQNVSHFFVLTTSRLLWFDVTSAPSSEYGSRTSLRPRLAWRHFRDPEDITLHLSDLLIDGALHMLVYSRLTELVQVFPFPFLVDEPAERVPVSDPFLLDMLVDINDSPSEKGKPIHFSSLIFREVGHTPAPVGKEHYNPDTKLAKLFWIDSSLAVHESLFKLPDGKPEAEDEMHPETSKVLRLKKRHVIPKTTTDMNDDNFIVDDWDETVAPPLAAIHQNLSDENDMDLQWTLDLTSIYASAVAKSSAGKSPESSGLLQSTFDHLILDRGNDLIDGSEGWLAAETMLELNNGRPVLEDIDDTALHLTRLVSAILPETPVEHAPFRYVTLPQKLSPVFPGMAHIPSNSRSVLDFLQIYDQLVEEWVTSVSHDIPRFTCVMKERVVRGIALDLLLSSIVRTSNRSTSKDAPQAMDTAEDENAAQSDQTSMSSQTLPSSQLPSSQMTVTGGISSQIPSNKQSKETSPHSYSGLSAFTTFKSPRPMARNVANLLAHWTLGADPSAYEWQKTTNMLEEEEARRTGGTVLPRRSRSRRRSQQPALSEAPSLPGTPIAPSIRTWGSQPADVLSVRPLPSSQPTLDEVPMTQIERGQFGAREVKKSQKAKKKRRAAGF